MSESHLRRLRKHLAPLSRHWNATYRTLAADCLTLIVACEAAQRSGDQPWVQRCLSRLAVLVRALPVRLLSR
jgi:hypothetical protein